MKYKSSNQQLFLHSFFTADEKVKEVNNFILHKYFDNNVKDTLVAIYTKESWERRNLYFSGESEEQRHIQSIMQEM